MTPGAAPADHPDRDPGTAPEHEEAPGPPAGADLAGFAATAADYDRTRRLLVDCYDAFYGTARELLDLAPRVERVCDLGAGTGLFTEMLAADHPGARFVLLDGVPEMLEQAAARLGTDRFEYLVGLLTDELPEGPFDAVVSALAIHHLDDGAKRDLYGRIVEVLVPGGVFVNADQVLAPTPRLEHRQVRRWRERATAAGATPEDLRAAARRMAADRCAPVEPQLEWLRDAGFVDVDCPFRDHRFAVLVGRRPG
ncbi:MAG: class I SAM-dependent methyltransferase [Actinomyces sp.]|nr:MAG: class I SAM-dependent methyltransferase [Actinomyces sp.]